MRRNDWQKLKSVKTTKRTHRIPNVGLIDKLMSLEPVELVMKTIVKLKARIPEGVTFVTS